MVFASRRRAQGPQRPSFVQALKPGLASGLVDSFRDHLRSLALFAEAGVFGAYMAVERSTDGPVPFARARRPWGPPGRSKPCHNPFLDKTIQLGEDREPKEATMTLPPQKTITKKELAGRIADETGQPKVVVKEILQRFLDGIVDELVAGNRLEFREFGVFEVRERAPRRAQNPRTLEKVDVPAKRVVKFKVGRLMRDRVCDEPPAPREPEAAKAPAKGSKAQSGGAQVQPMATALQGQAASRPEPPKPPPSKPDSPF
ncbi:MAG: D-aminoacyl-tRNA deacylase [Planctomycetes bacterium]|nr:D-aminoacyl-tRNA deacylase [Planctomycetota bacterium]